MVILPIIKKLRKISHQKIAMAQDILIEEVFRNLKTPVLHGGIVVWRCYQGNRFSEDIDFYLSPKEKDKLKILLTKLENLGFQISKKKFIQNAFCSKLIFQNTKIRMEVLFKETKKFITKEYETCEGIKITINTLSSEDLIKEKIQAYLKRFRIRDIYDIYFLLSYANTEVIKKDLEKLLENFKKPVDEKELKYLIITGVAPTLDEILSKIQKYNSLK